MLRLTVLILFFSSSFQQSLTPWAVNQRMNIFDSFGPCTDHGTKDIVYDLKLSRLSRQKVVLQGNISQNVPLDDKVGVTLVISEKGNGGWIERGFAFKMYHFCQDMLTQRKFWTSFWEKAGISPPITCPIPKGKYTLKDFDVSEMTKHIPGFKLGTFKLDVEFHHQNKTRLGCFQIMYHTAPRTN